MLPVPKLRVSPATGVVRRLSSSALSGVRWVVWNFDRETSEIQTHQKDASAFDSHESDLTTANGICKTFCDGKPTFSTLPPGKASMVTSSQ
jgi:hypothetical protein